MASNNPPTQPNEEEVIIRWSGKWFQYLFARLGLLRSFVNMIEDALSIGGRFFLLGYILYTAAKSILLLSDPNLAIPFWLDATMAVLQLGGLEGSIPGLGRRADSLRETDKAAAAKIEWVMNAAQVMTVLAFGEIALHMLNVVPVQALQWISGILLVIRGWVITRFLLELAKVENKAPRVVSRKEYQEEQAEADQVQVRMDNTAIQASIGEALANWTKQQDQVLADKSTLLAQQLHGQLVQLFGGQLAALTSEQERVVLALQQVQSVSPAVPAIDNQAIIAGVLAQFETRFAVAMKRLEEEVKQQILVSLASETSQVKQGGETLAGPRLVSLPQRSVASSRTVKQPASETAEADQCQVPGK